MKVVNEHTLGFVCIYWWCTIFLWFFLLFFNNFFSPFGVFVYYGSICGTQLIRGPKCTDNPHWCVNEVLFFYCTSKLCPNGPPINILMQTWDGLDDGEMGGHPMVWWWDGWSSNGMIVRWVVIQWYDCEMGGHPMEWWQNGWSSNGMMVIWTWWTCAWNRTWALHEILWTPMGQKYKCCQKIAIELWRHKLIN
jgi:hypothetical protein